MTRRFGALFLLVALALPMHAGFRDVVRAIETRHNQRQTTIPLLGFARFACWIVHPKGVYDFQLATFENLRGASADDFAAILREKVGVGYRPIVRVRSTHSGEFTFIYAKPAADENRMELFIVTHDRSDTVVIRLDADMEIAAREVNMARMHDPKRLRDIGR